MAASNAAAVQRSMHVFISYRREDHPHARLIRDRIRGDARLAPVKVFWDLDSLQPGKKYRENIQSSIDASDFFIVLVGPAWTERISELHSDADFLRFEIAYALERESQNQNLHVIPVVVEGASIPPAGELPSDLQPLTQLHQLVLHELYFDEGIRKLIDQLLGQAVKADGPQASTPD